MSDLRKAIETLENLKSLLQIQHRPGAYGVDLSDEMGEAGEAIRLLSGLNEQLLKPLSVIIRRDSTVNAQSHAWTELVSVLGITLKDVIDRIPGSDAG